MKAACDQLIRVLVVDDSRTQRDLLVGLLGASGRFEVVGIASDGIEAVLAAQRLRPQVIAMDVHLPLLDGYEATRQIMRQCPTPIVLITGQRKTAARAQDGLAVGALAVLDKPTIAVGAESQRTAFLTMLRLMADVQVVTRYALRPPPVAGVAIGRPKVLVIAASTGGPTAVRTVLEGLGASFPLPILLAQHIAQGFVSLLCNWLNTATPIPARIAQQGERLRAGHVYLAPQGYHMIVNTPGIADLRSAMPHDRVWPSGDLLFESAAHCYGNQAIGLVLTGMGNDGAGGLAALRASGAATLAQSADGCVVYGMPRAAVEAGAVMRSVPLAEIASAIWDLLGRDESTGDAD